jgi:antitoxin component of RelBE/YafQ-DinJ toxin-antitoxin module
LVTVRTALLTVRVTDEELAMAKALAEADGISASDFVRLYIRRAYAERFGQPKPTKKRK